MRDVLAVDEALIEYYETLNVRTEVTSMIKGRKLVGKVFCKRCGQFFGIVTDDGDMPERPECKVAEEDRDGPCEAEVLFLKLYYEVNPQRGTPAKIRPSPVDPDSNGALSNARKVLEGD